MKYMFHRCADFFNSFLILTCLVLSTGCGPVSPPVIIPSHYSPEVEAAYDFCGDLFNIQTNLSSKQDSCSDSIAYRDQFTGFVIPGFPPETGYCGETFGATCFREKEALRVLSNCAAIMPVCLDSNADSWQETWLRQCTESYNMKVMNPGCRLVWRKP